MDIRLVTCPLTFILCQERELNSAMEARRSCSWTGDNTSGRRLKPGGFVGEALVPSSVTIACELKFIAKVLSRLASSEILPSLHFVEITLTSSSSPQRALTRS